MTQIIAFAGRKQSGKTTSSVFVMKYSNGIIEPFNGTKIYNFADPLKQDICINILGLTYNQCYGSDEEKNSLTNIKWEDVPGFNMSWISSNNYHESGYMTAREVLQFVGTDIFRKMKHNVWADATVTKIKNEQPSLAIIADCRFPNEVAAIKNAGGYVIKLTRNPYNSNHSSETALDSDQYDQNNFDAIIHNESISISEKNRAILNFLKEKGILP